VPAARAFWRALGLFRDAGAGSREGRAVRVEKPRRGSPLLILPCLSQARRERPAQPQTPAVAEAAVHESA